MEPQDQQKHILIVDDDPDIRLAILMILESQGYRCTEAQNGEAALLAMQLHYFDLVITDYQMPKMNGLDFLRCLAEDPTVASPPLIMISGSPGVEVREQALEAGAFTFLQKPYSVGELLAMVKHALRFTSCACS